MTRALQALIGGLSLLAGCADAAPRDAVQSAAADPLLTPIAPEYAKRWLTPEEPIQVHGNTYLVGFEGLTVALIRTSEGLILVDGALPQAVGEIEANLTRLGLSIRDVKYILSTEPHYDHAGGLAALSRDSGGTVLAAREAAEVLASGQPGRTDPQFSMLEPMPPVQNLRAMQDGETVTLGEVTVTAHATPGHTPGSMSWSWRSCEGDDCRDVVFASSFNPISEDGYRFTAPANRSLHDGFIRTFAAMRALPCDILLSAHPGQSGQDGRRARRAADGLTNSFVDPSACRAYADRHERLFEARVARERAGTEP